jgi:hypothetical protein
VPADYRKRSSDGEDGFFAVPKAILSRSDLTPEAKLVYGVVLSLQWSGSHHLLTYEDLAFEVGTDVPTARRAVSELEAHGLSVNTP